MIVKNVMADNRDLRPVPPTLPFLGSLTLASSLSLEPLLPYSIPRICRRELVQLTMLAPARLATRAGVASKGSVRACRDVARLIGRRKSRRAWPRTSQTPFSCVAGFQGISSRCFSTSRPWRMATEEESFDPRTVERESDQVDVCIVGGGTLAPDLYPRFLRQTNPPQQAPQDSAPPWRPGTATAETDDGFRDR